MAARDLRRLERIHRHHGPAAGAEKRALVMRLDRAPLASAAQVLRFHEILLYLRAYPDDATLVAAVERALERFGSRADLRRFRDGLADSGISGTAIRYRFFWPMARWLAGHWPDRLRYDGDELEEFEPRLRGALPLLAPWIQAEAIKRSEAATDNLLDRLRGTSTGAAWVLTRLDRLPGGGRIREAVHDTIDAAYRLGPGRGGPSRTLARREGAPIVFREAGPSSARPDLRKSLSIPPATVRRLRPREATGIIDLAREAMVTRSRDLDAFAWADPRDVLLVDDGDGLEFGIVGVMPDRRLPLPAVHGWLSFRNGVPIGYVPSDTLLGSSEISFNTFPTFRGAEAAHVFSRVLAVSRHLLGARSFSIEPYQLGHGNEEGLSSGAWWFYAKLGFTPKDSGVRALYARERARMRRSPRHRSGKRTLELLAARHLFFEPDAGHRAVLPLVPALGLRIPDRDGQGAAALLGVRSFRGWTADERLAFERLAPVVAALPGIARWSAADRRALVDVIRAKGRPIELNYARGLDAHPKARRALTALLTRGAR